ncbi:MAG: hypothetical protein SNJ67_02160 [Chloracidobacterium sp.]|uniref:Uncharacterized protein n=1 Tax=Chloracidobacterium validum TaxID=2821543 RepID=A0ABX8B9H7_9BACT|nr:hypothetical protein [Chloracidobacterium validum]QUW02324.1 hypothetical protein J8C06_08140 [Chloracidobacterium validum]
MMVDVILWSKEVELRGLPRELETEYEGRGAFWVTRGLRMTRGLFECLEIEHPELTFRKYEVPSLSSADKSATLAHEDVSA